VNGRAQSRRRSVVSRILRSRVQLLGIGRSVEKATSTVVELLHDHLQQLLVLGRLTIGQAKRFLVGMPHCEHLLKKADTIFSDALTYTRTLVTELSPPVLREHGLAAGLNWLAEYMKKHNLTVSVVVPENDALRLPEDRMVLLFQSIRELLINSSKHAGTGQALVAATQHDGALQIAVSDEGMGFDPAATQTLAIEGAGLSSKFGLFSIRERMNALGGHFDLFSAPGKGTRATLILPLPSPAPQQEISELASNAQIPIERADLNSNRAPNGRCRVIIADDHVMVRQGLRSVLEGFPDIEVIGEASNGQQAMTLTDQLRPSVVLMDVNMPVLDGIAATVKIKARHPKIVVIGLSVNASAENEHAMKTAGASTLLTKEAAVDQLYGAIQRAVPSLGTQITQETTL